MTVEFHIRGLILWINFELWGWEHGDGRVGMGVWDESVGMKT